MTYRLKYEYKHEIGVFTKEDLDNLKNKYVGAADALLMASLIFNPDGSYSQMCWAFDGRNEGKALPPKDFFHFWLCMAGSLLKMETLPDVFRKLCAATIDSYSNEIVPKVEKEFLCDHTDHECILQGK